MYKFGDFMFEVETTQWTELKAASKGFLVSKFLVKELEKNTNPLYTPLTSLATYQMLIRDNTQYFVSTSGISEPLKNNQFCKMLQDLDNLLETLIRFNVLTLRDFNPHTPIGLCVVDKVQRIINYIELEEKGDLFILQ